MNRDSPRLLQLYQSAQGPEVRCAKPTVVAVEGVVLFTCRVACFSKNAADIQSQK